MRIPAEGGSPERLTSRTTQGSAIQRRWTTARCCTRRPLPDETAASGLSRWISTRARAASAWVSKNIRRCGVRFGREPQDAGRIFPESEERIVHRIRRCRDVGVSDAAARTAGSRRPISPRFGRDFVLIFRRGTGAGTGLWKLAAGAVTELWRGEDGGVIGPPSVADDQPRVPGPRAGTAPVVLGAIGRLELRQLQRPRCPRRDRGRRTAAGSPSARRPGQAAAYSKSRTTAARRWL